MLYFFQIKKDTAAEQTKVCSVLFTSFARSKKMTAIEVRDLIGDDLWQATNTSAVSIEQFQ